MGKDLKFHMFSLRTDCADEGGADVAKIFQRTFAGKNDSANTELEEKGESGTVADRELG